MEIESLVVERRVAEDRREGEMAYHQALVGEVHWVRLGERVGMASHGHPVLFHSI